LALQALLLVSVLAFQMLLAEYRRELLQWLVDMTGHTLKADIVEAVILYHHAPGTSSCHSSPQGFDQVPLQEVEL
jgi:hypothetical protein